jgi:hypothetical protein
MTSNEPDRRSTIIALRDAVRSAQSVADQLGLRMAAIKLDGAVVELKKAIANIELSGNTP